MYKIGVVGDKDSIYGFSALGFDIFPTGAGDAEGRIKELADEGYGVIYVTEKIAAAAGAQIKKYQNSMLPAVILIPGVSGNTGEGVRNIKASVEKAVGSDIVFGNEE
jgi:V/A-type H+-transporting ATPase subunit F